MKRTNARKIRSKMANKSNLRICRGISVLLLAMPGLAQGVTVTVGAGAACDFVTVQAGIDAANDGDTVLVSSGEYVIAEPITFRGKAITVRSEAGRDETTIRMGTPVDTNRGSVVVFENGETAESVLDGFTITGGSGSWLQNALRGGGIFFNAASATVRNCAIVQNTARRAGGVLCDQSSSARLVDCIVAGNSSIRSGGGLSAYSGSSLSLTNCIIRENSSTGSVGGGVVCWHSSSAILTNCTVADSLAANGGGISCGNNSSTTMTNCIITGNSATGSIAHVRGYAGGVQCMDHSSVIMSDCTIAENSAGQAGGAMFCEGNSSAALYNCRIVNNTAERSGGGLECVFSSMTVSNCTIWGNSADGPGGGVNCWQGSAEVTNSIVWANMAPQGREISVASGGVLSLTYSNVAGGQAGIRVQGTSTLDWGAGSIDQDPYFADATGGDYHLQSQAGRWDPDSRTWVQDEATSPCIDAGDPMSPIGWELFPNGGFVNMGAYGGTSKASKSYFGEPTCETIVAGDINGDGQVNRADLEIMALHWTDDEPWPLP